MKNKNILFIIDSLGIGGAEKVILTLAEQFILQSYNIHIISCEDKVEYNIPTGIIVHTLGFKKSFFAYSKYAKKLQSKIVQLETENSRKFDLILVNLQKSTKLMYHFSHPNTYHVIHNTLSQSSFKNRTAIQIYLKRKKLQKIYNNLKLITVSNGVKNDILENIGIQPKTIQTIYNPIDKEKIIELSKEKNPFSNTKYIVHVGRFHDQKRHDILLKAYKKSNIDAKLILIGDGSKRDEILKLIDSLELNKKIILTGFIQNPYTIINEATFLVLSSDYEGFGNVLVEALMLDTSVISTDCKSGPNEILIDELETFLVKPNEIDALASKMNQLYHSTSNVKIEKKYTNRFDIKNIIKAYEDLILS